MRAFRTLGCYVRPVHTVGQGFPDLYVSVMGYAVLVEVKDGTKPPSAQSLTPDEIRFHSECTGPVCVVRCVDDVVSLVADMKAKSRRLVA